MASAQGSLSNSIRLWSSRRICGAVEGVIDRVEPAIRPEVIVHDDASAQSLRDRAAFFASAIEGEGQARRRVQPLQLAGNAKPRFVEMANLRFGHAAADERVDLPQAPAPSFPTQATMLAGQISGAPKRSLSACAVLILGNELLDIEIDRRGPDALAILSGRDHSHGKRRLCLAAAMRAAVDRGLMFRNHERALGKVEHLALLDPDRRLRFERRTAMAAGARRVPNHAIRIAELASNVFPLLALLPVARLARAASQAARDTRLLLQTVARRRLGTVGAIPPQLPAKVRTLQPAAPRSGASAKRSTPRLRREDPSHP